jgi:hypothetical protein
MKQKKSEGKDEDGRFITRSVTEQTVCESLICLTSPQIIITSVGGRRVYKMSELSRSAAVIKI